MEKERNIARDFAEARARDRAGLTPKPSNVVAIMRPTGAPPSPDDQVWDDVATLGQGELVEDEFATLSDAALLTRRANLAEELAHVKELLGGFIAACDLEIERRIRASGGRAMAHPAYKKIEIEEEFGPYSFDRDLLNEAALLLPDDERAKVIRHVPEQVQVIAAHDEPGNPVSIAALIRKYGSESEVGSLLSRAMRRQKIGERLSIVPHKKVLPPGGNAR
jgi:hypothetical protein